MSDEHLERIEAKIDRVITTQAEHGLTLGQHTAKLDDHSQRFERLDWRLRAVEVTLETTVPQSIKQIAEGHSVLQAQIDRGFADAKKQHDERMTRLEDVVRQLISPG